jgi:hypothetical protein
MMLSHLIHSNTKPNQITNLQRNPNPCPPNLHPILPNLPTTGMGACNLQKLKTYLLPKTAPKHDHYMHQTYAQSQSDTQCELPSKLQFTRREPMSKTPINSK